MRAAWQATIVSSTLIQFRWTDTDSGPSHSMIAAHWSNRQHLSPAAIHTCIRQNVKLSCLEWKPIFIIRYCGTSELNRESDHAVPLHYSANCRRYSFRTSSLANFVFRFIFMCTFLPSVYRCMSNNKPLPNYHLSLKLHYIRVFVNLVSDNMW